MFTKKICLKTNFIFRLLTTDVAAASDSTNKLNHLFTELSKYNLRQSHFNTSTLQRLKDSNTEFIVDIVKNLHQNGVEWPRIIETFQNYDDWSALRQTNILKLVQVLRNSNFSSDISSYIISRNQHLIDKVIGNENYLTKRLDDLSAFFSRKQVQSLLMKTPSVLTDDFENFEYKFSYVYYLLAMKQDEMCTSFLFNHSIDYIRKRHLFLERSGFFDKPNKKGETKVRNPSLINIVDASLEKYLKITTKNIFTIQDYETFCAYIENENFDDELIGYNIRKGLIKNLFKQMRYSNKQESVDDNE